MTSATPPDSSESRTRWGLIASAWSVYAVYYLGRVNFSVAVPRLGDEAGPAPLVVARSTSGAGRVNGRPAARSFLGGWSTPPGGSDGQGQYVMSADDGHSPRAPSYGWVGMSVAAVRRGIQKIFEPSSLPSAEAFSGEDRLYEGLDLVRPG